MTRFIIYLFETGLCLSLLYLAYWLFLRRETYFNFNRIFLVLSLVLALSVPLLHLNFIIPRGSTFKETALGIVKFRDYYEELVYMIDADFGTEPGLNGNPNGYTSDGMGIEPVSSDFIRKYNDGLSGGGIAEKKENQGRQFSISRILLIIYIGGVMYFFVRFVYLVIRLYLLAMKNGVTRQEGFRMVEIREEISPFSFFRFLFINNRSFNESELQNVLEHEKAHIRQRHTMDHLFAHGLAVFQWFNPFAWQLRKALKTTHEYIADRQVIERGFEMFDYQSLLLKQVIGYHSVELVNNFNLKPIKKRIAMMNKKRSGIPARLKAMLVIPFAIIVFLLFAEFTVRGPGNSLMDLNSSSTAKTSEADMTGLWVTNSNQGFSKQIHFSDAIFSYMDGGIVKEYYWRFERGELILSGEKNKEGVHLKANIKGEALTIWWNDLMGISYGKSMANNTMDYNLDKQAMKIDLPFISQFRLMEKQDLVFKLGLGYTRDGKTVLTYNSKAIELIDLPGLVEMERSKHSKMEVQSLTAMFFFDTKMSMEEVVKVKQALREINSRKVAYAGYPEGDLAVSALQYHTVALPMLLPPMDAKILDKKDIEKKGTNIFVIDLSASNTTPKDIDQNLEKFIRENDKGKYVFSLEYDRKIPYAQYIETVDMVFNVVYRFRDEMAMSRFQVPYAQLGKDMQKEIRKSYPMVLSEAWAGE